MDSHHIEPVLRRITPWHLFFLLFISLGMGGGRGYAAPIRPPDGAARLAAVMSAWQRANLSSAERIKLAEVLQAIEADTEVVDVKVCARYYLDRLRQLEESGDAGMVFTTMIQDFPDHPLGQLARLKQTMQRLYAIDGGESEVVRLQAAEEQGRGITLPTLRGDFHLMMGAAYLFFGDQQAPALRHLLEAERIGIVSRASRSTLLVQIGELARLNGDPEQAASSYRLFLDEFPRDIRRQIVQDRLAELEKIDGL